jgi:PAS domain S-box-containing protein
MNTVSSEIMFDKAPYGIFIADRNGAYLQVNPAAVKITGYSEGELLEMGIPDLMFKEHLDDGLAHFNQLLCDGHAKGELTFKHKSGEKRWWSVLAEKISEDRFLAFCYDITDQVTIREKLALIDKSLKETNEEYHALNEELNQMNDELRTNMEDLEREKIEKQLILNSISDMVIFHDTNMNVVWVNNEAANAVGRPPYELHGRPCYENFGSLSFKICDDCPVEFTLRERKAMSIRKKRRDGRIWDIRSFPVFDAQNNLTGVVETMADITQRVSSEKALRESEEKFRSYVELAPMGIFISNRKGDLLDVNKAAERITGYSTEELLNMNLMKFYTLETINSFKNDFEDLLSTGRQTFELPYVKKDGSNANWIIEAATLGEDKIIGFAHEITEQKRLEKELIEAEEKFKKEVEIAKASAKFKQNFLANMSHEIRTPLTGVLGMIEILEQTQLDIRQREYLHVLRSSGENLKEIINQVLDFSKIEAGKVNLRYSDFEFNCILEDAHKLFNTICSKEVEFRIEQDTSIPGVIVADKNRISQVVNNLISNAVKFTHQGQITLKTSFVAKMPGSSEILIKIEVTDTGVGIHDDLKGKLFVPFSQNDENDTRLYEGTGLGLSISKELVYMHGGEIGVESTFGRGSNFWFTFVAGVSKKGLITPKEENTERNSNLKKLRILFAEDKIVNQKVVKIMINAMGHELVIAKNGKQAVEFFEPGKFDLILMDIQMPVMDGISATRELRSKYTNLPPIVGLSANAFEGDREKYMQEGLDEYLTKPINVNHLEDLLSRIL